MSKFSYIQIAVAGQTDGQLATIYRYPSDSAQPLPFSQPDPEAVIRNFLNARDCWVLQRSASGHSFSLVTRNPLEARSGYMAVSLMLADGYALTGRQVLTTLTALKKTLLEDGDRFDDAVTRCLEAVGLSEEGLKLESWAWKTPVSRALKPEGTAYRTYVSGTDLETILSFPDQPDYQRFADIIAISATASMRPGVRIERITQPVKKVYTVVLPEGVTASQTVVSEGDRLGLTFSKANFSPRRETVVVGAPSPYVRYDGSAIRVKAPRESGLGFVRRVKLEVRSAKGGSVTGYTINVNGRPVNTMEPYIELNELELAPGRKTEINVASTNYRPLKVVKESAEIARMEALELVLEPMEQGITLRLDFGEGRTFEQVISLEKNSPEYSQLHSGTFHGFRANRVTTPGTEGEVYNVDVRSGVRPQAPSFVNVTPAQPAKPGTRRAPVFENVSDRGPAGSHYRKVTITNGTEAASADTPADTKPDTKPEKPAGGSSGRSTISGNKVGYLLGAVLGLVLLILAFVFLLPGGSDGGAADNDSTATAFAADPVALAEATEAQGQQPAVAANPAPQTPAASTSAADEAADIEALNADPKAWDLSKLRSAKYQALVTAMRAGDIRTMAAHEYFAAGKCTGRYGKDVIKWAWESLGSPQESKNVEVIREASQSDRVNVYTLWEKISRFKPAQPNTQPMPSAN